MPVLEERRGVSSPGPDEKPEARHDVSMAVPSGESQPVASAPPVAELRYKVQFTADQAYVDLLEEACNLLQHELPARDLLTVQRRALELLVHKLRQRKYAARERPCPKASAPANGTPPLQPKSTPARPAAPQSATPARHAAPQSAAHARHSPQSTTRARPAGPQSATHDRHAAPQSTTGARHAAPQPATHSRYIPAEIRRTVWQRDEARCAYVDARGQRCREQSGLEFHHQHPHGRGGPPTIDNLALRCRSHNTLAAEQDFGHEVIRERRARKARLTNPIRAGAAP